MATDTTNALTALHRVLVRTRTQAYLGADSQQIARILDDAEYLAAIILQEQEGEDFRRHLVELEAKFAGFEGLVAGFDEASGGSKRKTALVVSARS